MRRAASAWGACLILVACNPTAPKPTPGPSIAASPTPVPLHISGRGTASQPVHTIYQVRNRI
ncbi:MAG TPA: hypothetical protein VNG31_03180, partial [Candidatus Baltobacteraceae bacterium]|nr:hypothetical protein [Candidatus Baltobacteraceae bacterium]